ncbi:MAG TPA: LysE family transporter, partial [Ktedonobacterales bacterium]|nr:LysE family transporter [Ktedonobacterales bacterium]
VLVIRRTLANGYLTGVASGMGAATADMLYGAVAAFGLTAISGFLLGERLWIHLIGAFFLGYLGVKTLLARPAPAASSPASSPASLALAAAMANPSAAASTPDMATPTGRPPRRRAGGALRLAGAYASTVALTLANPATILSFVAIFAGVGIVSARGGYASAAYTVAGVFCGSALWWLLLCGGVSLARRAFSPRALRWVSALSGAILFGFAVYAVVSVWV